MIEKSHKRTEELQFLQLYFSNSSYCRNGLKENLHWRNNKQLDSFWTGLNLDTISKSNSWSITHRLDGALSFLEFEVTNVL